MFCSVIAIKYICGFNILLTERHNSAYSNGLYRTVASVEFCGRTTFLCDVTKVSSSLICACGDSLSLSFERQSVTLLWYTTCFGGLASAFLLFCFEVITKNTIFVGAKAIFLFGTEKLKSEPISEVSINYGLYNRLFSFRKNNFNTPSFIQTVYIEDITKIETI